MTRCARSLPLLVAAAAAIPSGVAVADTQTPGEALSVYHYAVTVEGSANYARHDEEPNGLGNATTDAGAQFAWTAQIANFDFLGALPTAGVGGLVGDQSAAVSYRTSVPEEEYTDTGACVGGLLSAGPSTLSGSADGPDHGVYSIDARVLGGETIRLTGCSGALEHASPSIPMGTNVAEGGADPWASRFTMPVEAIGQGKVVQLLDRTVTGADCPGHKPSTTTCMLTWHARITFLKTGEDVEITPGDGSDIVVPIPPGAAAAPAPTTTPRTTTTAPPSLDAVLTAAAKHASLAPSAAFATIPLTCPSGCSGTATATATPASGHAAAAPKTRTLGHTTFTLRPGTSKRVTIHFNNSARTTIRRTHAIRLTLRLQAPGGTTQQRILTLRTRQTD